MMKSVVILIVVTICVGRYREVVCSEKPEVREVKKDGDIVKTEVDDRINLNLNHGHAVAYGPGGSSVSDALSRGVQVGIRRPGQVDQILYQKTNSIGSSSAVGSKPPSTYAGAENQIVNGVNRGGATAGFSDGSSGSAETQSLSKHIEIALDPYGTVLFSNLKEKPHHEIPTAKSFGTPEITKSSKP